MTLHIVRWVNSQHASGADFDALRVSSLGPPSSNEARTHLPSRLFNWLDSGIFQGGGTIVIGKVEGCVSPESLE